MRFVVAAGALFLVLFFQTGCSNTWHGVKEDTSKAVDWSREKVNQGADWVEEKTSR